MVSKTLKEVSFGPARMFMMLRAVGECLCGKVGAPLVVAEAETPTKLLEHFSSLGRDVGYVRSNGCRVPRVHD